MKDITVLDRLTGGSSRVTIVVHTHPDGDAVGSGTAMLGYLTDIKRKNAALIVPDSVPDSISFITKYKCIMKDCIFHFILSGPEIYIRKCSLAASAWSLCKIIVNQFFVFQFRSFEFRYHPCTTPPSLQASLSDPLQSGCRSLHPDHHSECYPVYEVSA